MSAMPTSCGDETLVDAYDCNDAGLRSERILRGIVTELIADLALRPVAPPLWHVFPGGGMTALVLLTESHLALHTFPERGLATFNLYCCRTRTRWPWAQRLAAALGASRVVVRQYERGVALRASGPARL